MVLRNKKKNSLNWNKDLQPPKLTQIHDDYNQPWDSEIAIGSCQNPWNNNNNKSKNYNNHNNDNNNDNNNSNTH